MRGTVKKVVITTDRSEASDGADEVRIDLARESGSRAAAVYVVDLTRLTHLHGYASLLGIKDSHLRDMLEESSKATGHVEKPTEGVQVPLEKIIL